MHQVFMAVQTRALSHPPIPRFDPNRFAEVLQRESQRVKEAVVGLGDPFAEEIVRQMAVVANGDMLMAGILPGIEVVLHHVAIDAGLRIVAEVAGALAVAKGERAHATERAQQNGHHNRKDSHRNHDAEKSLPPPVA